MCPHSTRYGSCLSGSQGLDHVEALDHVEGPPACLVVASGVLSEGWHDRRVVYLGDGQTEAYLKDMGMAG